VKGLDFGTTTSLIAESRPARTAVTPIGSTEKWLPSILGRDGVAWHPGEAALSLPEDQIIRSAKRAITERDHSIQIFDGSAHVQVSADEAITEILRELVVVADREFVSLQDQTEVRLGCPAIWDGDQRRRLIRLARDAGISVSENTIIDEPIAAGIAWINQRIRAGQTVKGKLLVFDMGGGTLDVAVLAVNGQPTPAGAARIPPMVSVQSSTGVGKAGDRLDDLIVEDFLEHLQAAGFDVSARKEAAELKGWIRRSARIAKIELSTARSTTVVVGHPTVEIPTFVYTREELETAFRPQLDAAIELVTRALQEALMSQVASPTVQKSLTPGQAASLNLNELAAEVQYVVLAGGMSHVPVVRERLGGVFGGDRVWLGADEASGRTGKDSTEMIAMGLSYHEDTDRMNLHRPGFDFVLEWEDPFDGSWKEEVVYQAHTPLYNFFGVSQTQLTKYLWKPAEGVLPRRGAGFLTVRSLSGERIGFTLDGVPKQGLPVEFGLSDFTVSLEPNGRVFCRDGLGRISVVRVATWPVIRGTKQESIKIETIADESAGRWTVESLAYHEKPYD
jgi:actin-like ATPase involved in cell morphogenesis